MRGWRQFSLSLCANTLGQEMQWYWQLEGQGVHRGLRAKGPKGYGVERQPPRSGFMEQKGTIKVIRPASSLAGNVETGS